MVRPEENTMHPKERYVQIYCGESKGKTTSSIGLTVRALSYNWKVLAVQFLKTKEQAFTYLASLDHNLTVRQFGRDKITLASNIDEEDIRIIRQAWDFIYANYLNGYDMVVLDEVLPALNMRAFNKSELYAFIKSCREHNIECVMTGRIWSRHLLAKLIDKADLVSDIKCRKHYMSKHCTKCDRQFDDYSFTHCPYCGNELKSVFARKGIEL